MDFSETCQPWDTLRAQKEVLEGKKKWSFHLKQSGPRIVAKFSVHQVPQAAKRWSNYRIYVERVWDHRLWTQQLSFHSFYQMSTVKSLWRGSQ